jgi:hypothetical protein
MITFQEILMIGAGISIAIGIIGIMWLRVKRKKNNLN